MQFDFIKDLDDYFCEVYANYDKVCLLPGYVMPKMQDVKTDEFGDLVAYTLPANTMRLSQQQNKAEILRAFKEKIVDGEFSFTFSAVPWYKRIKNIFKKAAPQKALADVLKRRGQKAEEAIAHIEINEKLWKKVVRGAYQPTKNLIFSLALANGWEYADAKELLVSCGEAFDYTTVRDTVIAYLLMKKIANRDMQNAALAEYKVRNLFLKEAN